MDMLAIHHVIGASVHIRGRGNGALEIYVKIYVIYFLQLNVAFIMYKFYEVCSNLPSKQKAAEI